MAELNHNNDAENHNQSGAADLSITAPAGSTTNASIGSSVIESEFKASLSAAVQAPSTTSSVVDDHLDHGNPGTGGNPESHTSLDNVSNARGLNLSQLRQEARLDNNLGRKGDVLDPGAGKNTVIGSGDKDVILANKGGFNTITSGRGRDTIIFGKETTNLILDFDVSKDRIMFDRSLDINNIVIAQGKNPGKGGINQPLDSVTSTLIIDKSTDHILGSLAFTNASSLADAERRGAFKQLSENAINTLSELQFSKVEEGNGKLTGTRGSDKLVGGDGDDFLYVGDDGFQFKTAKSIDEFPFPTDSPGTAELKVELKNGVMRANGKYQNFDGLPLFSQGETTIDPNAKILNGANPQALIDGFLKVPQDVEGNKLSGTHLHNSPAGDRRGNFADATVIRFFENTPNEDKKSGTLKGEFNLTPEEQAALLAGNLYVNVHTNIDGDGDGRAGFPTGEARINLNRDVVRFV
jgi:hypothetical protein